MNHEELLRFRVALRLGLLEELCIRAIVLTPVSTGIRTIQDSVHNALEVLDQIASQTEAIFLAGPAPPEEKQMFADEHREIVGVLKKHVRFYEKMS